MSQPLINITKKQAIVFALFLVLYEFLVYIANDMIMPAMIHVVKSFNASNIYIASSLSLYVLGGASLQILLGPVSDKFGRRPVMLFGVLFFLITTFMISFSANIHQFLWLRFFEGMGLCYISVIGYAVIQEIFAEMDAVRLIAVMTNIAVTAPLLGPLVGALLANSLSWHYIFILIGSFTLLAIWGLWKYMPEPVGQIRLDGEEIKAEDFSWRVIYENYSKLVKNPKFFLSGVAFGFLGIGCVAWIGLAPIILVSENKLTLIQYGLWQVPVFGAFIIANIILIKLTYRCTLEWLILVGSIIAFLGLVLSFGLPLLFGNNYIWLMPGIILYFFGFGFSSSPIYKKTLYATKVSKGTASALLSMTYMSIQGLGVEAANLVYTFHQNYLLGAFCAFTGIIYMFFYYKVN